VPLLEEAAGYSAIHTTAAENELKRAYLELLDNRGFSRRYTGLLEKQMNRRDVLPEVFAEAADYYLGMSKIPEALAVLRAGIEKTDDDGLINLYENSRYVFELNRAVYDDVASIYGSTIKVQNGGLWGLARTDGTTLIPCEYEKISTFSGGRAIVKDREVIYAVDKDNNRVAVAEAGIDDFGNLAENRIPLQMKDGWRRATGEFVLGSNTFEEFGMYSGGYAAI
jgi:hypothetical protein